MKPEDEDFVIQGIINLTSSVEALNQVVTFLLARTFSNVEDPEEALKALFVAFDHRVSLAEEGREGFPGEPLRDALDNLYLHTQRILSDLGRMGQTKPGK